MKSLFKEMGGTYTLDADGMYYPDLTLSEEEPHYGKYGRMRLRYLKEHHKALYNTLLLDGKLVGHLNEIDDTARRRMELLTGKIRVDILLIYEHHGTTHYRVIAVVLFFCRQKSIFTSEFF